MLGIDPGAEDPAVDMPLSLFTEISHFRFGYEHTDRPREPFNGGTDLRSRFCPTAFRNQELSPFNLPNILTCKASNFFPIFIVLKTLDASYN